MNRPSVSIALFLGVWSLAALSAQAQQQTAKWHPTYSAGWADGYCRYT
ncbi:hypothetical protein THAOC_04002, partial [Thalassiosira oceanica]